MDKTAYKTVDEVLEVMKQVEGHQFKEYDINNRLSNLNNKGALGQIVEEGILGYNLNSSKEPDIKQLKLEVKTTGIIKNKKTISAKERLAIDSLNYKDVVKQDFENSDVWKKCQKMLLVFYGYIHDVYPGDFKIIKSIVNEFPKEDIEIMKNDYFHIVSMIKEGKAHEISEGDTMYLGACTAGTGALQEQPYSSTKAKQRKFSIKQPYFTALARKLLYGEKLEHIFDASDLISNTFEIKMHSKLDRYIGWDEERIYTHFDLKTSKDAKNRYERYIASMLGLEGKVNNTDEFTKSNTELKTIRINSKGRIVESMSFPFFEFTKIVNQDWEESDIKNFFENKRFMFAIFKEVKGKMVFTGFKFWNMPSSDIESSVKKVFDKLKEVLKSGNIVSKVKHNKDGKEIWLNNFPSMLFDDKVHIRPHGKNKEDTYPLPINDRLTGSNKFTKQCFWLKNSYIKSIIEKGE